jgi:two-component system, OmpR family, alkaline phosphatase synthesis response regulator PhoP
MKKILVADDQLSIARALSELLTSAGYDVILASDGEMAVEMAIKEKPDLIIMDIMMPKKTGIEAVKIIRESPVLKSVFIIFISAKAQINQETNALEVGGDSLIYKPFSPKAMLSEVSRAFNQK